jgi:polar amino acid transport system substrate-binding protein
MKRLLVFFILAMPILTYGETLRLVFSDVEVSPYQMGNGSALMSPPGIAVDIIVKAAKNLGYKVHFIRVPNKRVLLTVQNGKADGAFIFSYKPEREQYGKYPMKNGRPNGELRIASMSYYFYSLVIDNMQWNGKNLKGKNLRVGANSGYSIVADLKKMGFQVEEAKTTSQNFQKLKSNRFGAVAAQSITADAFLKFNENTSVERLDPPIKTKDYFLMLSHQFYKKSPKKAQALWREIALARDYMAAQKSVKYLNK